MSIDRTGRGGAAGFNMFSGDPSDSIWSKHVGGIVAPLFFPCLAIRCWIYRKGVLPGTRGTLGLVGARAIAMGFVWLGLAVFLYCHFGIRTNSRLYGLRDYGRDLGAIGLAIPLVYIIYTLAV